MNRLRTGVVGAVLMVWPMLAAAQTVPPPAARVSASLEREGEPSLLEAIRRQARDLALSGTDERSSRQGDAAAPAREERSWIGRHPALFGAMVGASAGTIAAGTMDNELFCGTGSDEDCVFYTGSRYLVGAGIGAGVGALVGWISSLGR